MNGGSVGIVLRRKPGSYNKIALLDKQYGRIECMVNATHASVGALFSYVLVKKQGNVFLQNVRLLYIPLSLAQIDLLFLHHVFELIYYFAPVGSCVNGIFDLLAFLYMVEHMLISVRFKKFFLFKLLTLLGVVSHVYGDLVCMHKLRTIPIDTFDDTVIDEHDERGLDRWLWDCVMQHPYIGEFKTVYFLEKNRVI